MPSCSPASRRQAAERTSSAPPALAGAAANGRGPAFHRVRQVHRGRPVPTSRTEPRCWREALSCSTDRSTGSRRSGSEEGERHGRIHRAAAGTVLRRDTRASTRSPAGNGGPGIPPAPTGPRPSGSRSGWRLRSGDGPTRCGRSPSAPTRPGNGCQAKSSSSPPAPTGATNATCNGTSFRPSGRAPVPRPGPSTRRSPHPQIRSARYACPTWSAPRRTARSHCSRSG